MVAIYQIESKLHIDDKYNCTFKTVDAVLPGLMRMLYTEGYDFEIASINDVKSIAIIKVYYEYDKRQDICQLFSIGEKEMCQYFNMIAMKGVL